MNTATVTVIRQMMYYREHHCLAAADIARLRVQASLISKTITPRV